MLMHRTQKMVDVEGLGMPLSKRIGMKKAKVAVARKIAILQRCIWVEGASFEWGQTRRRRS